MGSIEPGLWLPQPAARLSSSPQQPAFEIAVTAISYSKTSVERVGSIMIGFRLFGSRSNQKRGVPIVTNNFADHTRNAVRSSWGITHFALMIATSFAPIYLGIGIGFMVPVGGANPRPVWLLGLIILLLPVAWFVVSQPLVLIGRIGTGLLLRHSPRRSSFAADAVESVVSYVVLVLFMRLIFDSFAPSVVGALVAVALYTILQPYVERRYNAQSRDEND